MTIRFQIIISILIALISLPVAAAPSLVSDASLSKAGYFQLHWTNNKTGNFILEEASTPDFSNAITLYQGPDTATLISGRKNGNYFYRVRGTSGDDSWSKAVEVKVAHHPLSRALLFFSLGAIVFLATLTMVIRGNLAHKHNSD